jgi:hypothetical protein
LCAINASSTGLRTDAAKETVSQNRTTHGLCGRFPVLANGSEAEYDDLLARFMQAEHPADDCKAHRRISAVVRAQYDELGASDPGG